MNNITLLPAVMLLAGCVSNSAIERSREFGDLGQYQRAFDMLEVERQRAFRARERIDPALEQAWAEARQASLLDRGRRYIFLELEPEALVALAGVLAHDPDQAEAKALRQRALEKMADAAVVRGDELLTKRNLEAALEAYLDAEGRVPGFDLAIEGQEKVRAEFAKLTERAQRQFLEAVRKLPEFRYIEVRWHSSNALVDEPLRADALAIRKQAQREIARVTMKRGRENERNNQFGAALIEFREAKRLDETLPDVDAAIAAMERELAASKLAEEAQMHMRRLEFDEASARLDEAFEMSIMLRGGLSELMIENRRMRGERDYRIARDFEIQGLKQEALDAFLALSADWPDGLEDEKERIEGLQSDIASAKKEWELAVAAEQAGKLAEAIEHYEASHGFYARLGDAEERIARLRAQMESGTGGGGQQAGGS